MSDSVRPHRRQPTRLPHSWDSPGKNTGVGCHFLLQCRKVKSEREVAQSCPTLRDPMDCSPPGSPSMGFSRQEYWSGVPSSSPVWGPDVVKLMLPSSSWTFGCRTLRPTKELAFWILFGHWGARESGWKENFSGKMTEPLRFSVSSFLSPSLPFFLLKILLYLTALVLVVAHRIFYLHHVRSSSLTRDWTQAPCIGSTES